MRAFSQQYADVDCMDPWVPTVELLANHFQGPIMQLSMFSYNLTDKIETAKEQVKTLNENGRANVAFCSLRQYVDELGLDEQ